MAVRKKTEFREIIEEILNEHSHGDKEQTNLASEVARELMSEKLEEKLKTKFYIFRINRLITGD